MNWMDFIYNGRLDIFEYQRWSVNFFLGVLAALYLVFQRKRGENLRQSSLILFLMAVLFTLPGISYVLRLATGSGLGRSAYEFFPVALLVAEASCDILARAKEQALWRRGILVVFLLLLIPAGVSVGDATTHENIARNKNFTGVSENTAWMCGEIHRVCGDGEVECILPLEYQKEVGITDTGIICPQVDYRNATDTITPYIHAAREYDVHIIVVPVELAEPNVDVLHANGFNVIQYLLGYQIWTNEELD